MVNGGDNIMSVNDIQWGLGSVTLYTSSGSSVTIKWGLGSTIIKHELVEAEIGWTGKVLGVSNIAKIMGIDVINISKVNGV